MLNGSLMNHRPLYVNNEMNPDNISDINPDINSDKDLEAYIAVVCCLIIIVQCKHDRDKVEKKTNGRQAYLSL